MKYSPENFDIYILIFIYVHFMSLKAVCPQGTILSRQGVLLRAPVSNISALLTKRHIRK